MLENILTAQSSRIVCVDSFDNSDEYGLGRENQSAFLTNTAHRSRQVDLWYLPSNLALHRITDIYPLGFQLCYVDGSHERMDVLHDAMTVYGLTVVGGIIIFDDYNDPPRKDQVKWSVDVFLQAAGDRVKVLREAYQLILQKVK